jgi:general secretion pathway protein L
VSTLYIRVPSKSVADQASHWIALACPYAVASATGAIEREGYAAISTLSATISGVQRVVILLAASDVTMLQVSVPPMSPARLRAALPHLVEEQLITDPGECVIVSAGRPVTGKPESGNADLRTVAVIQRGWLQILLQTFSSYGARHVQAIPSQSCLRPDADTATAALTIFGTESGDVASGALDLALQFSAREGLGLCLALDPDGDSDRAAKDVIEALCAVMPMAPVTLYVPHEMVSQYQQTADLLLPLEQRITVYPDQWANWIAGMRNAGPDLATGIDRSASAAADLRRWRWPLVFAGLAIVVNVIALNIQWWQLARESAQLRRSMLQTYQTAYPKETVIVDPVAQMQQKIAIARHDAGQSAPDDFAALTTDFAIAWNSVVQPGAGTVNTSGQKPEVDSLEYRDHVLYVRPKNRGELTATSFSSLKTALSNRNLSLSQSAPGTWQIRLAK